MHGLHKACSIMAHEIVSKACGKLQSQTADEAILTRPADVMLQLNTREQHHELLELSHGLLSES